MCMCDICKRILLLTYVLTYLPCVAEIMSMESVWSLGLVVKSVVMVAASDECSSSSSVSMLLHQQQFVESISYLAQLGTGLSRKWTVEDLEVSSV